MSHSFCDGSKGQWSGHSRGDLHLVMRWNKTRLCWAKGLLRCSEGQIKKNSAKCSATQHAHFSQQAIHIHWMCTIKYLFCVAVFAVPLYSWRKNPKTVIDPSRTQLLSKENVRRGRCMGRSGTDDMLALRGWFPWSSSACRHRAPWEIVERIIFERLSHLCFGKAFFSLQFSTIISKNLSWHS